VSRRGPDARSSPLVPHRSTALAGAFTRRHRVACTCLAGLETRIRILIVEDDSQLGEALASGLRQLGHVVDWFRTGSEADNALGTTSFDAVVLDLGLPGGDGMVWLARWRASGVMLPVLILTARDAIQQRIAGLDGGADDYLVKPITIDELAARLRALVRRSSGQSQAVWNHGQLAYDPAAKVVRWKGMPVDLTGRELAVLEVLMLNPGRVLSKNALLERLYHWGYSEPESNTLEVHIHRLRRKIDPSIVKTVRGVGYALGSAQGALS
jgi:two-component system response regulator QseB